MILCTEPANGYGVMFFDGSAADLAYQAGHIWKYDAGEYATYPLMPGWAPTGRRHGDNIVMVIGPIEPRPSRCWRASSGSPTPTPTAAPAPGLSAPAVAAGALRLCRYGVDDWLEQSELLTGKAAENALGALEPHP